VTSIDPTRTKAGNDESDAFDVASKECPWARFPIFKELSILRKKNVLLSMSYFGLFMSTCRFLQT
jgi:hypothetical protein